MKKIEERGNYLYITDTVSGDIEKRLAKGNLRWYTKGDEPNLVVYLRKEDDDTTTSFLLTEAVDVGDTPFTLSTISTFLDDNTGFNPASGGSGANGDYLDKVTLDAQTVAGPVEFFQDITVPSGSVILGKDGAKLSSAGRALHYNDARKRATLFTHYHYDETGSEIPSYYKLDPLQEHFPVNPDDDGTVINTSELAFVGALGVSITTAFYLKPTTNDPIRLQVWEGSDDTGAILIDQSFNNQGVTRTYAGVLTRFELPVPLITEAGDLQFVRITGTPLIGAIQSSGAFIGELQPYLEFDVHLATIVDIVTLDDIPESVGYILATWGANIQTLGRHPAINSPSNAAEITSLGIMASIPVPATGILDTITYYNNTGDNTTTFQIIKNGQVAHTFTCIGPYGAETGINLPIGFAGSVPDNIAIRYFSGTAPSDGLYTAYVK